MQLTPEQRTVFTQAFDATCQKRGTVNLAQNVSAIIANINEDDTLQKLFAPCGD